MIDRARARLVSMHVEESFRTDRHSAGALFYRDVAAAVVWLTPVFGFCEHTHYGGAGGPSGGAQMNLGEAW